MSGWQDIASAPRDGTYVLIWSTLYNGQVVIAQWNDDRYARKPIPRWATRDVIFGRKAFVDCPPTHWMPLPDAPTTPFTEGQGE